MTSHRTLESEVGPFLVSTALLARIMHEGSDFGIDTKASAWYKCFVYRHLPTTEALA